MRAAVRGLGWIVLAAVFACVLEAAAAGFDVTSARIRLVDDVYRLDAALDFDLSKAPLEALENGVALTIAIEVRIFRPRRYWLDERVARVTQRYRLQYHALSNRYVLVNMNSAVSTNFDNLSDALRTMGTIEDFPLVDRDLIRRGQRYQGIIIARLDIEELPAPMRPLAYVSSDWRLSGDRYAWSLRP